MEYEFLVAGNMNIETRVRIEAFPIEYEKTRFLDNGIRDRVAGVGFNVVAGLAALGHHPCLAAVVGRGIFADLFHTRLNDLGITGVGLVHGLETSARSLVVEDVAGHGAIFTDLKRQEEFLYPPEKADTILAKSHHVHVTNIMWAYEIGRRASLLGKQVSTDLQALERLGDVYNQRFVELADIVFFSGERLQQPAEEVLRAIVERNRARIAVCTMGSRGAVMALKGEKLLYEEPAVPIEGAASTTGAGDAFAACFLSSLALGFEPLEALHRSQVFAAEYVATGDYLCRADLALRADSEPA